MRRPGAPTLAECERVLTALKPSSPGSAPDRERVLEEAATPEGFAFGDKRRSSSLPVWRVQILVRRETLTADLFVAGWPVYGLDWHQRRSRQPDGSWLEPGYHWDIRPPLAPAATREYLLPQPSSPDDALTVLGERWRLRFLKRLL